MGDKVGAVPQYMMANEFARFEAYLADAGCTRKLFEPGEQLWRVGEFIERVYYIKSGVARTEIVHENGREKTLLFHGQGTIWPNCQKTRYQIELSMVTTAITRVDTFEFSLDRFRQVAWENKDLAAEVLEEESHFVNLGFYEAAHQIYNSSQVRLCNLLYLLYESEEPRSTSVKLPQSELAKLLGIDRTNVARYISALAKEGIVSPHRGWIEITDVDRLEDKCTAETRDDLPGA